MAIGGAAGWSFYPSSLGEEPIKRNLIFFGPLTFSISSWAHAMVLTGYFREPTTGDTVWILKNSWGVGWGDRGYGYLKVGVNNVRNIWNLQTPVSMLTPRNVACRDDDGDGYANWGMRFSQRPLSCGEVRTEIDCDDSDPALALWTDRGDCIAPLPEPETIINHLVSFVAGPGHRVSGTEGCTIPGEPNVFAGKYVFDATLKNVSTKTLSNLAVEVAELMNGNRLQNADGGPTGTRLTVPHSFLAPAQSANVPFVLCLRTFDPFRFKVNVLGTEH
jgi:hypothetical protein